MAYSHDIHRVIKIPGHMELRFIKVEIKLHTYNWYLSYELLNSVSTTISNIMVYDYSEPIRQYYIKSNDTLKLKINCLQLLLSIVLKNAQNNVMIH